MTKLATLYPDRITLRYPDTRSVHTRWAQKLVRQYELQMSDPVEPNPNSIANLQKEKTTWELSGQTKRKLSHSFALLNHLSPSRTIWAASKKPIYNFKTSFVTLTLPALQMHADTEIKGRCLNNFFNVMREKFGLKNYVWKAELQKNENIHFHIVWDLYIHHNAVRYYWNQSLELLGYVSEYQQRFQNMTLKNYAAHRRQPVSQCIKAYRAGVSTRWLSPPTEQVVAVRNALTLAKYLNKYILKPPSADDTQGINRLQLFGRVWGRSQSLSKIVFSNSYDAESLLGYLATLGKKGQNMTMYVHEYCTVYYFNFRTATPQFLKWLNRKMYELGITYNYQPSGLQPVPI